MRKRIALLSLVAVFLLLSAPMAGAAKTTYFLTYVNHNVQPIIESRMPFYEGGVLYAPITAFQDVNDRRHDIAISFNSKASELTFYTADQWMTLRVYENIVYDDSNSTLRSCKTITKDGVFFVPVADICAYFDVLSYRTYNESFGMALQIQTPKFTMSQDQIGRAHV